MINSNITKSIRYLFDCDFFSENFDPEGNEEHQLYAEKLIVSNDWTSIFENILIYFIANCKTPKSVYNFCNLYTIYGFIDFPIANPYEFLGLIFFRADIYNNLEKYGDFFDSFSISILETNGIVNLFKDPYYNPFDDKYIINEVTRLRKEND